MGDSTVDKIFGETFRMLRNIRMAFHFLDNDMIKKNYNYNDQIKTGICKSNMVPAQRKSRS